MKLPFLSDEEWRWRWMQTFTPKGNLQERLHRIKTYVKQSEERGACVEDAESVCGLKEKFFVMPGLFSRMGAKRCDKCCKILGIPPGEGAPYNAKPTIPDPSEIPENS